MRRYITYLTILTIIVGACKSDQISDGQKESPEKAIEPSKVIEDEKKETKLSYDALPQDMIKIGKVDLKLLEHLVHEGINTVRESEGIKPMSISGVLQAAAKNQNEYQIKINSLSHYQKDPDWYSVKERVERYGGEYKRVGENVQFQGFTRRKTGDREEIMTTSYFEAADDIVQGWVNSPGHYRNVIDSKFTYVGTAVAYSPQKKALFATQVFGGFY